MTSLLSTDSYGMAFLGPKDATFKVTELDDGALLLEPAEVLTKVEIAALQTQGLATQRDESDADHAVTPIVRSTSDGQATESGRKYPHKVGFYQDPAETDRMRGAFLYTMTTEGHRNLSEFINHAAMARVQELEAKYNQGIPFPPISAGDIPQGGAAANR